jgi:hypothetical protein
MLFQHHIVIPADKHIPVSNELPNDIYFIVILVCNNVVPVCNSVIPIHNHNGIPTCNYDNVIPVMALGASFQ